MNIDAHCHFDQLTNTEQQQALKNNIIIAVATDYHSCQQLLKLAKQHNNLKVCLGIHPEYLENYAEFQDVNQLLAEHRRDIVAIGEVGLPWFRLAGQTETNKQAIWQQATPLFEEFVLAAKRFNLALNLHCVKNGIDQAISLLKQYQIQRVLFHWFGGSKHQLQQIIAADWFISVNPDVIYNQHYFDLIKDCPVQALCLESDAPWPCNGERSQPDMIVDTAKFLAPHYNMSWQQFLSITNQNSQRLFNL